MERSNLFIYFIWLELKIQFNYILTFCQLLF